MTLNVAVGDQIPSVGLRASDGYLLNLRSFVSKQPAVLLFFGGPTMRGGAAEPGLAAVRSLAAGHRRLHQAGIAVVGISCDSEQQQREFAQQQELPFLLMSDERRTAVGILGIPTTSQRDNVNVARPVLLAIDRDGAITAIIERVEPQFLIEQVMSVLSEPMPAPAEDAATTS